MLRLSIVRLLPEVRLAHGSANRASPFAPTLIVFFLIIGGADELRELNELIQGHLKCHEAEALLHVSDELGGEFAAEADLSKDIPYVGLDSDILVDHGDLLGIKGQLPLLYIDTFPEFMDRSLDARTNLRDTLHLLHGSLQAGFRR